MAECILATIIVVNVHFGFYFSKCKFIAVVVALFEEWKISNA
jgi:hypothetical protein